MSHDDPFESFQREIQRLFHDVIYHRHPASHFGEPSWSPPADVVVHDGSARVVLELAGVPRENVRVRLQGALLEVSGRREPLPSMQGADYHRAEIYFGPFRRLIELPWAADPDQVRAHYKDGMLEILLVAVHPTSRTEIRVQEQSR